MSPLMNQLHDIEGLDPISWWPLGIGWWIVIISGLLLICGIVCFVTYRVAFNRSWKRDTFQKLAQLENNLSDVTARESLILLSEYLRRIALRRFSRNECAGLIGADWLKWLAMHDPKQFDWETKGALLIEVPYSPLHQNLSIHQIQDLIQVVKQWVR